MRAIPDEGTMMAAVLGAGPGVGAPLAAGVEGDALAPEQLPVAVVLGDENLHFFQDQIAPLPRLGIGFCADHLLNLDAKAADQFLFLF
jgi:hypothetical protein